MSQIKPTGDHLNAGSNSTPQALGTAGAGMSVSYSRADHVHAMPSASDVGALGATAFAGGDLSGAYPNPTVAKINGKAVASTTPSTGQVLTWNGLEYAPSTPANGGSGGGGVLMYFNQGTNADSPTTNIPGTPKELGRTAEISQTTVTSGSLSTTQWDLVAGFVSDVLDPDLEYLPGGIFDFNIWGATDANVGQPTDIRALVYTYSSTGTLTLIATSGNAVLPTNGTPLQTSISLVIPQTDIALSDRLYIAIEAKASTSGRHATLSFGDSTPSHVHTTIPAVGGTGIFFLINGTPENPARLLRNTDVASDAAIAQSKIANLTNDLASKVSTSQLGALNGVAQLDGSGTLRTSQIPALTTGQIGQITPSVIGAVPTTRTVSTTDGLTGGGTLSGDLTLQLTTTGVAAGLYGSATKIPALTIDDKGRITAASEVNAPSGLPADVQVFTANSTWTKPSGAKAVNIQLLGGGGGGGSGRKDPSTTVVHCGGGGGGGGSYLNVTVPADSLASSVSVTIGAGGAGGAAQTTTNNGSNGVAGGNTIFGAYYATGGGPGQGGTIIAGTAGLGALNANNGGAGNASGGAGGAGNPSVQIGVSWMFGGPGGAGGGGISSANVAAAGGAGGRSNALNIAGGGAGNIGTNGTAGNSNSNATSGLIGCGSAGGGGGGNTSGTAGSGGAGGFPAAGGGGGGASSTGDSGAGGAGGAGIAIITTYF